MGRGREGEREKEGGRERMKTNTPIFHEMIFFKL